MRPIGSILLWTALGSLLGCGGCGSPSDSGAGGAMPDIRALFVGNSLTLSNDLPALVQIVAEAADASFAYSVVAVPGVSLEDHWDMGEALRVIERDRPDVVILQQGPSSLPESRVHLIEWSERFAVEIRAHGGRPALYMVWPQASRVGAFDAVRDSYAAAADAVDGLFLPAGEAWRAAWQLDPDLALYGPDGFHPTRDGSLLAALVMFRVLYDRSVADLPLTLRPSSPGLQPIVLDPERARVLFDAAESAAVSFGKAGASRSPTRW